MLRGREPATSVFSFQIERYVALPTYGSGILLL